MENLVNQHDVSIPYPWRKCSGFTLIELLVSIAIMVLLSAILFPVFSRARENARRSSCASNMKQIGLGIAQYIQDYDERFPIQPAGDQVTQYATNENTWITDVQPYVKAKIFACPSAPRATGGAAPLGDSDASYLANGVLISEFPADPSNAYQVTLMNVLKPSEIAILHEFGNRRRESLLRPYFAALNTRRFGQVNNDSYDIIHFEGANYLFVDGHVKWKKKVSNMASLFGTKYNGNNAYHDDTLVCCY